MNAEINAATASIRTRKNEESKPYSRDAGTLPLLIGGSRSVVVRLTRLQSFQSAHGLSYRGDKPSFCAQGEVSSPFDPDQ